MGDLDTAKSGVPDAVTQSDIQRGPWVLRTTSHVFGERHKGRHDVVVINNDLEYHFNPENVVEKFLIKYHNSKKPWVVAYSVVVFREGTLMNMGDGGDINWDWQGNLTSSGLKLATFKPCIPGVKYKLVAWHAV